MKLIGKGAYGQVYQAEDLRMKGNKEYTLLKIILFYLPFKLVV